MRLMGMPPARAAAYWVGGWLPDAERAGRHGRPMGPQVGPQRSEALCEPFSGMGKLPLTKSCSPDSSCDRGRLDQTLAGVGIRRRLDLARGVTGHRAPYRIH